LQAELDTNEDDLFAILGYPRVVPRVMNGRGKSNPGLTQQDQLGRPACSHHRYSGATARVRHLG
jgi:hypothetical protein